MPPIRTTSRFSSTWERRTSAQGASSRSSVRFRVPAASFGRTGFPLRVNKIPGRHSSMKRWKLAVRASAWFPSQVTWLRVPSWGTAACSRL